MSEFAARLAEAATEIADGMRQIDGPAYAYIELAIPGEENLHGAQPVHRATYITAQCGHPDSETAIRGMIRQAQLARESCTNAKPDDVLVWRDRPDIHHAGAYLARCRLTWIPAIADACLPKAEVA